MRIVVTGGAGDVGSRVVREVAARGHQAVPASRRTGVDLATGEGLEAVLAGADAVVHCADDTSLGDT
ncbi:MAG: sugar nucleotide-binding protein, partial [Terrabacter sp.]|nr:sugar nucleotide-binding protein [Terrabacter sp.]